MLPPWPAGTASRSPPLLLHCRPPPEESWPRAAPSSPLSTPISTVSRRRPQAAPISAAARHASRQMTPVRLGVETRPRQREVGCEDAALLSSSSHQQVVIKTSSTHNQATIINSQSNHQSTYHHHQLTTTINAPPPSTHECHQLTKRRRTAVNCAAVPQDRVTSLCPV